MAKASGEGLGRRSRGGRKWAPVGLVVGVSPRCYRRESFAGGRRGDCARVVRVGALWVGAGKDGGEGSRIMGHFVTATPPLMDYLSRLGAREHPAQRRCRVETLELGRAAGMQIAPEQGSFLALIVKLIGATRCLEIGTFTGYSALSVALALPPEGAIVALDVSKPFTDRARAYWREAGVEGRIDLRIGPGLESLDAMIASGEGPFDFAFIDADKTNYDNYYERALKLVRPGGLIAFDNMLWSGAVADETDTDPETSALRALNAKIHADPRVDMALATIGDGVMLARVR
jgi:caffeoyl-CoA O-methyltransferase